MSKIYSCHKISGGRAEGEVLISEDHIMFYLMDPVTGKVLEKGHSIEGKSVSKKILIFPGGKGSSVVQADGLFQLNMHKNMPAAMIIQHPETVLVSSAIIMDVPMVDKVDPEFYNAVKDGSHVIIDADAGRIELLD